MTKKEIQKRNFELLKSLKSQFDCDDFEMNDLLVSLSNSNTKSINESLTLVIKDLNIVYKDRKLLENVSFEICSSSFHVFIGENGAGKSTTIKTIIGINQKFQGKIYFKELDRFVPNKIAYVPDQQPKFPKHMSVYDYLFNTTKLLTNYSNDVIKSMIDHYMSKYDLEHIIKNNVNKLSTGQKQKILLISAFMLKRKLIILDEPFANLDPTSRFKFLDELRYFVSKGTSVFLSSHILDEIKDCADYATFIRKGKILYSQKIEDKEFIISFYKQHYIYGGNNENFN